MRRRALANRPFTILPEAPTGSSGPGDSMRGQALPEFVLGSVQLGLEYGAANRTGKPAREGAVRLLRHAQASGVAAFDTARSYGEAEERLGEAFGGGMDRIVTKLSPLSNLGSDAPADIVRN